MKKIICFLLVLCTFVGIVGCTAKETPENSITVYYRREKLIYGSADSVIAAAYLETDGRTQNYKDLLNQYFAATPGDGFATTFPEDLKLVSFKLEGLTVKVVLSDQIAAYSGMNLTIALTCLTQTIMSLTGCHEVIISANTAQLDGQNFITLNRDSYLLLDDSGVNQN